jgi:hypothetical protein
MRIPVEPFPVTVEDFDEDGNVTATRSLLCDEVEVSVAVSDSVAVSVQPVTRAGERLGAPFGIVGDARSSVTRDVLAAVIRIVASALTESKVPVVADESRLAEKVDVAAVERLIAAPPVEVRSAGSVVEERKVR